MTYSFNFRQEILAAISQNNDTVDENTVLIITNSRINEHDEPSSRDIDTNYVGVPLSWEQHSSLLNYTTYVGFGRLDCHEIRLWTAEYIYYIHEYDGSHWVASLPRNPPTLQRSGN